MLFKAARENRLEALYVVLAVTTGLRQGELLGLKWKDVDLNTGGISVQRTLSAAKNDSTLNFPEEEQEPPQREAGYPKPRSIASPPQAPARRAREARRALAGPRPRVHLDHRHAPEPPQRLRPLLQAPPQQGGGLPHTVRFHDLRHTYATLLCSKNVNPKVVQEMLGHANISCTINIYSHVLPNMQDEAAAAMESALT